MGCSSIPTCGGATNNIPRKTNAGDNLLNLQKGGQGMNNRQTISGGSLR